MNGYRWLNDYSLQFLKQDYLLPNQTVDERVSIIGDRAEKLLQKEGFSAKFKDYFKKGWFSLSTPIWANFGTDRGLPISCFSSFIEDDMASILHAHAEIGMMTKYGGGTSAYFGELRCRGQPIRENGQSSGAVHFMRLLETELTVISQGACYAEGTEVLTSKGFKDFRQVQKEDLLAQVDESGVVSFTTEYELVQRAYKGKMKCFKGGNTLSVKVTPNHRMVVERRKSKDYTAYWPGTTEIVTAEELSLHRDNRMWMAGQLSDSGQAQLTFADRFRIAYQADGRKDGENRKIRFRFKKMRKVERLQWILENLQLPYEVTVSNGIVDFVCDYDADLKVETFSKWVDLSKVSYTWAEQFVSELQHWDGGVSNGCVLYSNTNQENVAFAQAVAAVANKRTSISVRPAEGNRVPLYKLTISDNRSRGGDSIDVTEEDYDGTVYCAVVPQGRLVVRYEGCTLICGNTRRGNCAVYLPIDHCDIEEFLQLRTEGNPIQDLSYGVCVPDYWLEEMIDGDAAKRAVWAKVLQARANTGYPYLFFTDNANNHKPKVYKDKNLRIYNTQLCTEVMLPSGPDESFVCDLSSMNVLYYDEWKDTDAVEVVTYLLDAVMEEFIRKAQSVRFMERAVRFAKRHRALGIGWLGWHSLLQSKGIPFESMEAKTLNVQVAKTIEKQALAASRKLAKEYGEPEVLTGYGMRNTTLTAIAPTKSSSFILGQVSEGIEPIRSNYMVKDLAKGKFTLKNVHLEKLLEDRKKNTPEVWESILKNAGSVQHLKFLSERERAVFKTFAEISPMEIIQQAAQRQKYVDQGQSLNLLIDPKIPVKDVNALLLEGWKLGLKSYYYQISVNAAQQLSRSILSCTSCEA